MWTEFQHHFREHILERNCSTLRVERGLKIGVILKIAYAFTREEVNLIV